MIRAPWKSLTCPMQEWIILSNQERALNPERGKGIQIASPHSYLWVPHSVIIIHVPSICGNHNNRRWLNCLLGKKCCANQLSCTWYSLSATPPPPPMLMNARISRSGHHASAPIYCPLGTKHCTYITPAFLLWARSHSCDKEETG